MSDTPKHDAAQAFFDLMPDPPRARIVPFNNADACGLIVKWAKKGMGFGEITMVLGKAGFKRAAPRAMQLDTETMSAEFCGEMFMALANDPVRAAAIAFLDVYEARNRAHCGDRDHLLEDVNAAHDALSKALGRE